jgi:hypothetical protein
LILTKSFLFECCCFDAFKAFGRIILNSETRLAKIDL